MDEKLLRQLINQIAEQAVPNTANPIPSMMMQINKTKENRFSASPTVVEKPRIIHHHMAQIITVIIILPIIVLLTLPQGRVWAQQIYQFFIHSDGQTIPLSEEKATAWSQFITPRPTYQMKLSTSVPEISSPSNDIDQISASLPGCADQFMSYNCQAAAVEQIVGFDLKSIPVVPPGYIFSKFIIQTPKNVVLTIYQSVEGEGWLTLYQGMGNANVFDAPAEMIETVQVKNVQGEYVRGMFVVKEGSSDMTWLDDGRTQRIGWLVDNSWFMLEAINNPHAQSYINKTNLLVLAENLTDIKDLTAPVPNPQRLNSMKEAENLAGFPILKPGLLPEDFMLDYAQYDAEWKSIHLFYQGKSGILIIKQTNNSAYILRDLSKLYPITVSEKVRNTTAIYANHADNSNSGLWSEEGEMVLFWREGKLALQIIYRPVDFFGGQMGEKELVAIGNSLK